MVAAAAAAAVAPARNPSPREDLARPPLIPSESNGGAAASAAAAARRPRAKEIGSRYLSSFSSPSPAPSASTSCASSTSSSSSSSSSRRLPSPVPAPRPSATPALPQSAAPRRSHSVGRARPAARADPRPQIPAEPPPPAPPPPSSAAASRAICTTTRSLSVSFQGESFFYQTSRAKAAGSPKPTPERRRLSTAAAAAAAGAASSKAGEQSENSRPSDRHHRWPAAKPQASNPLARSLDYSLESKNSILATVHLLQQSMVFDDGLRRASSFDADDLSASSDTDSVSSGSNSGAQDLGVSGRARVSQRGISVPARFWPETSGRLGLVKRSSVDSPFSSPRSASSPLHGPVRASSPCKVMASPSRGMASPLRGRSGSAVSTSSPVGVQPANAPSIISFAVEVRRAKKGENRIEEAHVLRLLDNRHLQWRFVNARIDALLLVQRLTAEKNLYNAWISALRLRDSVTSKRIKLQLLMQNLKLTSILKGQMSYLESWSLMDRDHSNSLSGAIEALKASTLRLPVVGGAKADIQDVKDAVGSAVDAMQAMTSSMISLLSKVEGANSLVSELAKAASQELKLLDQSRDLLSTVAALHVKLCSLQGHILQRKCRSSKL
ncbi:protein SNOWY COTYLEDON 3-like [Ananas comosus]|uniref:Protein SNOWY COTYLEDON 3-like n=1 Tax=Ananas comosus TaxID=4615 RepID=A0A6P5G6S1_ANACO|nr:protein SNOWY COTYLEDON 3-like [Ananas comosus]